MEAPSVKFTIHRFLENTAKASELLQHNELLLMPIGDPIQSFVLCVDSPEGRRLVGVVPNGVKRSMLQLYERSTSWRVKWCSDSIYFNESVMWIEVFPELDTQAQTGWMTEDGEVRSAAERFSFF